MSDETRVYREWRVTGTFDGTDFPDYDHTWSAWTVPHICATDAEAETAARQFASVMRGRMQNLKLSSRTVTVTPWAEDSVDEKQG